MGSTDEAFERPERRSPNHGNRRRAGPTTRALWISIAAVIVLYLIGMEHTSRECRELYRTSLLESRFYFFLLPNAGGLLAVREGEWPSQTSDMVSSCIFYSREGVAREYRLVDAMVFPFIPEFGRIFERYWQDEAPASAYGLSVSSPVHKVACDKAILANAEALKVEPWVLDSLAGRATKPRVDIAGVCGLVAYWTAWIAVLVCIVLKVIRGHLEESPESSLPAS